MLALDAPVWSCTREEPTKPFPFRPRDEVFLEPDCCTDFEGEPFGDGAVLDIGLQAHEHFGTLILI
jgi:hypothetical protein